MLLDHDPARREGLPQDADRRPRIGRAAHENIERGEAIFGPAMDGDMRLGENRDPRYAPVRREMVKMDVQKRRTGDLNTSSQCMLDVF
jgi:hypothetical protein